MFDSRFKLSIRQRGDTRRSRPGRLFATAKYLIRSLGMGKRHARWLEFLATTPPMQDVVARDRRLIERYQHRYISLKFDRRTRLDIVHGHYRFITGHWPKGLLREIYVGRSASIGKLALRDGSTVDIVLKAPPIKGLEGELGIYLCDENGMSLSSIIVTIADEGRTLLIGCIQGAHASAGKEAVRELTRQCHGLRPKNLLLSLAYGLAAQHGIEHVRGVGQAVHPFAGLDDKIKSDYNGFWIEAGGIPAADGLFDLPARDAVRDAASVESKHRAAFRRREALRGDAVMLLCQALAGTPTSKQQAA